MDILIVEDHDLVRNLMEIFLADAGHHVISARTAEEAMKTALTMPHLDILVADILLNHGTGFDVQVFVRERHPRARTLFVSGYAVPETDAGDGSSAFLEKPFSSRELLSSIAALSSAQTESQLRPESNVKAQGILRFLLR